jgi:zinc-ribbon domain
MALITCPDCSKQISDSASACIHCGRPMHTQRDDILFEIESTRREIDRLDEFYGRTDNYDAMQNAWSNIEKLRARLKELNGRLK